MEELLSRYRNISVLLAVLAVQFILLGYQVRRNDVRLVRVWAVTLASPLQRVLNYATDSVSSLWSGYVDLRGARQESEQLRAELDDLKLEGQRLRAALLRFQRIDEVLAYRQSLPSRTLVADVIGVGANPNAREIFVDKGPDDGVKPGMAVITADGIVGQVHGVFSAAGVSLVLLISDPDAAAGVILADSRVRGVLKGTGATECRLDYIRPEIDVRLGEVLYTSGYDRLFPKGLPVGEVSRLGAGGSFREIWVRPFAQLDRLEEVLIVTEGVHLELPELRQSQPPSHLMPLPLPEPDLLTDAASEGAASPDPSSNEAQAAQISRPEASLPGPETDADRLRKHYEAVGAAQGHQFGEGVPGSPEPDFNLSPAQLSEAEESNETVQPGEPSNEVARPPGESPASGNNP